MGRPAEGIGDRLEEHRVPKTDAREVLEYEYKKLSHECIYHMELHEASDRDLVNCYKSLQKLNENCEKLRGQLKELEEAALPIAGCWCHTRVGQRLLHWWTG
jgi:hypothetical protein